MRWPWRKPGPDPADDAVAAADAEVEVSRQRLRDTHENVVKPLRAAMARNNFAVIIAASLAGGHRQKGDR